MRGVLATRARLPRAAQGERGASPWRRRGAASVEAARGAPRRRFHVTKGANLLGDSPVTRRALRVEVSASPAKARESVLERPALAKMRANERSAFLRARRKVSRSCELRNVCETCALREGRVREPHRPVQRMFEGARDVEETCFATETLTAQGGHRVGRERANPSKCRPTGLASARLSPRASCARSRLFQGVENTSGRQIV